MLIQSKFLNREALRSFPIFELSSLYQPSTISTSQESVFSEKAFLSGWTIASEQLNPLPTLDDKNTAVHRKIDWDWLTTMVKPCMSLVH